LSQTVAGEAKVELNSKDSSYLRSLPEDELAIDASYRNDCTGPNTSNPRTIVWFGATRPKGPVSLLLQAHDNDAYFMPDGDSSKQIPCSKMAYSGDHPATAYNAECVVDIDATKSRITGIVEVLDLTGIPAKTISIDVVLK
jgi:hypothetical protein